MIIIIFIPIFVPIFNIGHLNIYTKTIIIYILLCSIENDIILIRIPSHVRITGNEITDQKANIAKQTANTSNFEIESYYDKKA